MRDWQVYLGFALGLSTCLGYTLLWFAVRVSGPVRYNFSSVPWVRWLELWVEPVVLLVTAAYFLWGMARLLTKWRR